MFAAGLVVFASLLASKLVAAAAYRDPTVYGCDLSNLLLSDLPPNQTAVTVSITQHPIAVAVGVGTQVGFFESHLLNIC